MRLLVTRPAADAARTAAALKARGHEVIVAPLLTIEYLPETALGDGPWSTILVTSGNAAHAIAGHKRRDGLRRIPVFAVGKQTAQELRAQGFTDVTSADGDVNDLADLVAARRKPPALLLYLAGEERSGDLAGALRAKNFVVDTVVVYRTVAAQTLPEEATAALAAGIDGVLHYSRRSAGAFVAAARKSGLLEAALSKPVHYCLSARVAEPLAAAGAADVRIATRPDEAALMSLCG
ncbi:MAG: uroporphyrinogen-III synthase [Xanthobacteraceae bacterium]